MSYQNSTWCNRKPFFWWPCASIMLWGQICLQFRELHFYLWEVKVSTFLLNLTNDFLQLNEDKRSMWLSSRMVFSFLSDPPRLNLAIKTLTVWILMYRCGQKFTYSHHGYIIYTLHIDSYIINFYIDLHIIDCNYNNLCRKRWIYLHLR